MDDVPAGEFFICLPALLEPLPSEMHPNLSEKGIDRVKSRAKGARRAERGVFE